MLPKKFRITIPDFQNNKEKHSHFFGEHIDIFVKKNNKNGNCFVFTVPKYVDKRSSFRHRIKRLMVENIRSNITSIKTSYDFLVKCKKKILSNQEEVVKKEINLLLDKLAIINKQ
jgi:ribonuclease P protein component